VSAQTRRRRPTAAARSDAFGIAAVWLLALSSFVFLPGAFDEWVWPKLAVAAVGIVLAAITTPVGRLPRWALWLILAAAVVLVIAALTGAAPLAQLLGRWPRYEGAAALPVYLGVVWAGARLLGPGAPAPRLAALVNAISAGAIAAGILAVIEAFGLRPLGGDLSRPGSLFGQASDEGTAGVVLFAVLGVLVVRVFASGRRPVVATIGLAAGALLVVLSASRGAAVAGVVVLLLGAVLLGIGRPPRARLTLIGSAIALVACAAAIALAIPATRGRMLPGGSAWSDFGADRGRLWSAAAQLLAQHPLLGVGPSGFMDAFSAHLPADWFSAVMAPGTTTDSPHSWPLQLAAAGGLPLVAIGLAAAAWVVAAGLRRALVQPNGDRGAIALGATLAVIGCLAALLASFTSPAAVLLATLLAGVAIAQPAVEQPETAHSRVARPDAARRAPTPPPAQQSAPTTSASLPRAVRRIARIVPVALGVWAAAVLVTTAAEFPLERGVVNAQHGRIAAATASFSIARGLRPWDSDVTLIAAQSLTAAASATPQAPATAVSWAMRADRALPDSALAVKTLAAAQDAAGHLGPARAAAQRAVALSPHDPEALARLGLVDAQRGAYATARTQLDKAVAIDPTDADSWQALGYVSQQLGDTAGEQRATAALAKLGRK